MAKQTPKPARGTLRRGLGFLLSVVWGSVRVDSSLGFP